MYKQILRTLLHRPRQANKYDFGHVLVIGGSSGMVGALYLAGKAALRSGAGLVTVASTAGVIEALNQRTVELLTLRLPKDVHEAAERVRVYIKRRHVSVVAIGPGMTPEFARLAREIVGKIDLPVVCDASAVGTFNDHLELLKKAKNDVFLTPHDGEFRTLAGVELPHVGAERQEIIQNFAEQYGVVLVAKGHPTLVVAPGGRAYTNTTGSPALATAGTGDVLTGILAALVAQHVPAFQAAELAVYLHGLAGDLAEKEKTEPGVIASDVIDKIPAALQKMSRKA